ncbi:MAG: hypothetical protein E7644_06995 [Ruminococcaceae bacterium]|nr:hypothetical protein [Oscillospiraceae bacterium]
MQGKTNYGKIIAITIAIITATTAIAYVLYRLTRNLLTFCSSYEDDEEDLLDLDEMEEELFEEEDVNLFDEVEEAPAAE